MPDAWEHLYGLEGKSALATADPDNDGRANSQEYNAGTNPIVELNGTGDVLEYVPGGSAASMFFKVSVRLSDDY